MHVFHNVFHAVSSVFGCPHDRLSRPFTIAHQSYMVCLTCGHQVFYSMDEMRRLTRREVRRLRVDTAGEIQPATAAHTPETAPENKDTPLAA